VRSPRASISHARPALLALLLGAAIGFLVLEPWHGPVVLTLSEGHGVDAADLPAVVVLALALAAWQLRPPAARTRETRWSRPPVVAAGAIVLGALLLAGLLNPRVGSPLIPAGGGTFDGSSQQVDGRRAEPVGRWTYLAVTYDGSRLCLYVDGVEVANRGASGTILRTDDPLWIGGNQPYGEYFRGVIDEVRVYDRALGLAEVRAAMSTPVDRRGGSPTRGLVAAYGFDAGRGSSVADASGHGNFGTVDGAKWTSSGRFGEGMAFQGPGDVVRVPESASLDLTTAMSLTAWVRPSETQEGWRTVLHRQTDAYSLVAGGGRANVGRLDALDRLRFALEILLVGGIGLALARGHAWRFTGSRRWFVPVALFVAGSAIDVAFPASDMVLGPTLVAIWWAATSMHRDEVVCMSALAAAFTVATILAIGNSAALPLPQDAGGVVRSAALGLVLATAGALSLRRGRCARGAGPGALV
jgi:hypothetical protein